MDGKQLNRVKVAVVQKIERPREGIAIMLNNVWHTEVINLESISSRIPWIKLKFSRVNVCVLVGIGSGMTWTG